MKIQKNIFLFLTTKKKILRYPLHRSRHYVPLSSYILERFLRTGFILKEDIIKVQHNCKSTPQWKNKVEQYNFLMIMHEHLFVFRKPEDGEDLNKFKESMRWGD